MKTFKKLLSLCMALAMVLALTACGGGSADTGSGAGSGSGTQSQSTSGGAASGDPVRTIKFAHWFAEDHPQHLSLLKFKELVEERSGGTLLVEIYPNSQLGSEDVYDQSVSQGTVEMGVAGTNIQMYLSKIAVSEAPFLFDGWDDARAILTGEIGEHLVDGLIEGGNMRCLQMTVNGWRQMSSNKPMYSMDDFKGQKLRTPNIPHFIQMMDCLGATSVPMAMSEIFNALETKVADGQENPYPTIYTSSFYEVQKYVLESNHMFSPNFWIINEDFYQSLSDAQREALESSLAEAAEYNWDISVEYNNNAKQAIADSGITTIIEPDSTFKQQMRDAMDPVYDYFYGSYEGSQEWVAEVRDYQANH